MKDGPTKTVVNALVAFIPRRPAVTVERTGVGGFLNARLPENFSAQQAPSFSNNDSLHAGVGRDSAHAGSWVQVPINSTEITRHDCAFRTFQDPARIVHELQTAYLPAGPASGMRTAPIRRVVDVPQTQSFGTQYPLIAQNYPDTITNLG